MLVIGSTALKHHFPDFNRIPKDIDLITNDSNYRLPYSGKVEYLRNPVLQKIYKPTDDETIFITANDLYTLKISHVIGWDISWEKHIYDIQFLKEKGCYINMDLFYQLYDFWNNHLGKNKRSVLDMSSDDFFDNAIQCEHNHDWLHTLIKDVPTYNKVLKDGAEVDVDMLKFKNLTYQEKCDLVREEVYVMGYERFFKLDYRKAYEMMLKKFTLFHAPIEEAIFIVENFKELHKPTFNFITHINNQIQNVNKHNGN